jgi:hypothetical protein
MRADLFDLELIFPVNDRPSANLMLAKGYMPIICRRDDVRQAAQVFRRATEVLYRKDFPLDA